MGPLTGEAEILGRRSRTVVVSAGYITMAMELSYRASSWEKCDSEPLL
jgi:hypothetical protein